MHGKVTRALAFAIAMPLTQLAIACPVFAQQCGGHETCAGWDGNSIAYVGSGESNCIERGFCSSIPGGLTCSETTCSRNIYRRSDNAYLGSCLAEHDACPCESGTPGRYPACIPTPP